MINKLIFNYRLLVFIYVKMNNLNDYLLIMRWPMRWGTRRPTVTGAQLGEQQAWGTLPGIRGRKKCQHQARENRRKGDRFR